MEHTTRDHSKPNRSYVLVWEGNNPTVKETHWQPGYTNAHQPTVDDAVKYGMQKLTHDLADMREKWLKINTLLAEMVVQDMEEADGSTHSV